MPSICSTFPAKLAETTGGGKTLMSYQAATISNSYFYPWSAFILTKDVCTLTARQNGLKENGRW